MSPEVAEYENAVKHSNILNLSQLLKSNDPPLESDVPFIRAVIWDGQTEVDALNKQIHDLQATLAGLVQRRDMAAENVRQHRAIISPVRCLRPELLCDIFALSLNDKRQPPWHFGHICQSWRRTAVSYPPLWCSIATLSLKDTTSTQTQLLRSATAPLNISCGKEKPIDAWFDLVFAHSRRWRTLHIHDLTPNVGGLDLFEPVRGRLDQLQELTITCCYGKVSDVFAIAPNLRRVVLTDTQFTNASPHMSIPWEQITHYRGTCAPETQTEILKAAQNLLFCEISLLYDTDSAVSATPTILPHLRGLSLAGPSFLTELATPVLETLVLHYDALSPLPSFIQRSSCTLNKLVVKECDMGSELISVLRDLPALAYLLLERSKYGYSPQEFFQAMTFTGTTSILCPNLTTMVYGHWDFRSLLQDGFLTMARSRFQSSPKGASRLGSLRLYHTFDRLPPADLSAQIAMLCAEGFDAAFLDYQDATSLWGLLV
ncbi:hypothetical protein B0H16DRAFT_1885479 [Mycena metata]|uniref:F-box domain-containing protein n=1 Tax=Mycena metata TaxID=1033252 RepID=A0AAD7NEE8_9AGAR|nr:hypothetical protein B0H16DRAFT_1885479 [Mycena metata]